MTAMWLKMLLCVSSCAFMCGMQSSNFLAVTKLLYRVITHLPALSGSSHSLTTLPELSKVWLTFCIVLICMSLMIIKGKDHCMCFWPCIFSSSVNCFPIFSFGFSLSSLFVKDLQARWAVRLVGYVDISGLFGKNTNDVLLYVRLKLISWFFF